MNAGFLMMQSPLSVKSTSGQRDLIWVQAGPVLYTGLLLCSHVHRAPRHGMGWVYTTVVAVRTGALHIPRPQRAEGQRCGQTVPSSLGLLSSLARSREPSPALALGW
jgi:hypothetical protein